MARSLNIRRGFVYWAELAEIGRKRVLVVSWNAIHGPLFPICAVVTSNDRERSYPTYARIEPSAQNGLTKTSYVLCHALIALPESQFDAEPAGQLDAWEMGEVDAALLRTLDLPGASFPPAPLADNTQSLLVGTKVGVRFGGEIVPAFVVEDRGVLAGDRIVRIRLMLGTIPVDELERVPEAA